MFRNTSSEISELLYVHVVLGVSSHLPLLSCQQCQKTLLWCTAFVCTLCVSVSVHDTRACARGFTLFPVIILRVSAVSNEALAVWLCNHANQHHTRSQQGYYRWCRTLSKADLLLADLLCPPPTVPVNDTTALMWRMTRKERERDARRRRELWRRGCKLDAKKISRDKIRGELTAGGWGCGWGRNSNKAVDCCTILCVHWVHSIFYCVFRFD